ncbi:MAG: ISNCY family transposase [Dehalococcoidia bacterium]|nr:ISNCY family transposase [Dehalococcoidia bacterium]
MNAKEQQRLMVLNQVLRREITGREAGTLMGVSVRHMRRLLAAYREEGAAALAHGNRGRVPVHALAAGLKARLVEAAQTTYAGCNCAHLSELLAQREGLVLSRSSVWRVLTAAGLKSPRKRRSPQHRCRRQRMPQEGMLVQLDGSPHAWLGDRGPKFTLLLAVDDATGTVPCALFREHEDTEGYLLLLQGIIVRRGIPLAVYTDRHAVFQHQRPAPAEDASASTGEPTQFGRAMRELGVTQVFAHSPEAKGRVERANGTFQDRLVAELRLAGASSLQEANRVLEAFLPRFNARFGVPAAESGPAYRLPEPGLDVDGVLCVKERRIVAKDNTVQYQGRTLQLFPGTDRLSYARAHVEIQERLDGRLLVCCQGRILTPGEAPPLATTLRSRAPVPASPSPVPKGQEDQRVIGKLTPNPIWYEDTEMMFHHRELVKVGMERARQQGKHIGRPSVTERPGFPQRFEEALERIRAGRLSRRRAARDMDIGYATLKRLLEARGDGPEADMNPAWEPQESTAQAPKANTEVSVVIPG